MLRELIIQPYDRDYNFLEDIGKKNKSVYTRIKSFRVLPRRELPDFAVTRKDNPIDQFAMEVLLKTIVHERTRERVKQCFEREGRIVYAEDMWYVLSDHPAYNPNCIMLAIIPYLPFKPGKGGDLLGTADENMAVVSTFGIEDHESEVSVGVSIHEVGHTFGLEHCKNRGCIMEYPTHPEYFYNRVYRFCGKHESELRSVNSSS